MIDFIAQKAYNPKGQLEKIDIPSNIIILPMLAIFENRKSSKIDQCNVLLVYNQLANVCSIMELASSCLIDSSGNISKTICGKAYRVDDINAIELISSNFLLSSIIYYNASFDYFRVLLRYAYSSHNELIEDCLKEKERKEIQKLELKEKLRKIRKKFVARVNKEMLSLGLKRNWELALGLIITKTKIKTYLEWINNNETISDSIRKAFNELTKMNRNLRTKYQANQLKHGAFPHFERSDPSNLIGGRMFETLEQFYDCKSNRYDIGTHTHQLQIDEVQNFLIKYHNCTAKLITEIVGDIGLNDSDTDK